MNRKFLPVVLFALCFVVIILLCFVGYNKFYKNNNSEQNNVEIYTNELVDKSLINDEQINNVEKDIEEEEKVEERVPVSYTAVVPIYMYHWIKDDTGDYPWPENMVKPSTLEDQVKYLVENDFDLIYITDLEKVYNYKKPVALTFDDGWHDVYLHMFPLAKKYNVKFSMYIIEDMVGQPGYCNEEQLKEMAKSGLVDIQAHTVTHRYLAELSYDEQKLELNDCKTYLKETYGIDSTVICYPYGSRNEYTVQLSKEAGYVYGLDMDGGVYYTNVHTDPLKIPRIYATRSMSIDTFALYANKSNVNVVWE